VKECVEMHQLLEVPLLTPEADEWKEELWQMPQEFDTWRDAQMMSLKASEKIQNIQDVVFPLANTFRKAVLDNLWIRIDQVGSCYSTTTYVLTTHSELFQTDRQRH